MELSNKAQILTYFLCCCFCFVFLPQSFQEDQWKRRSKSELIVLFSVSSRCSDVLTFSSVSQLTLYLGKRDYVDDISKVEQVGKFPTVGLVQSSYHSGRTHLEPNLVSDQFPIKSGIIRPQSRSEVIIVNGEWVNKTLHHSFRVCFCHHLSTSNTTVSADGVVKLDKSDFGDRKGNIHEILQTMFFPVLDDCRSLNFFDASVFFDSVCAVGLCLPLRQR